MKKLNALHIIEDALYSMGGARLSTWCVRGSAMWKLQSALRYLMMQNEGIL